VTSTFTWLDYSERDRRRALDVIDLFDQPATLDELGIGTIRDGLADLLFPGTSTIQTRARYFLFVPWVHQSLEHRRVPSVSAAEAARREEGRLMEAIRASADSDGLVGGQKGERVKRLAGSVYWGGLGVWGIRAFQGSQAQYYRSLDHRYRLWDAADEEAAPGVTTWHAHLPAPPRGFPAGASFALEREEALYLQERIRLALPRSLLRWIVDSGGLADVRFPWDIPAAGTLPIEIASELAHARCLSETQRGAALLYNLLLAEALPSSDLVEEYREAIQEWAEELAPRLANLRAWDPRELWALLARAGTRVPQPTQWFVEKWCSLLRGVTHWRLIAADPSGRTLVSSRELELKRDRARLRNRRYLEMWSGRSGTEQLDFRWGVTRRLLRDIFAAL
jgi:hypothetical protein